MVVCMTLLSLLALHKVWVSFSFFGLIWVVYVLVFKLNSALFYDPIPVHQKQVVRYVVSLSRNFVC